MTNSWHSRVKDSISRLNWFCKLESGLLELNFSTILQASKILQLQYNVALCFHDSTEKKVLYDNRLTFLKHDACIVLTRQNFEISFSFSRLRAEKHDLFSCFWLPLQNALTGRKKKKAWSIKVQNDDEELEKRMWKDVAIDQMDRFIFESLKKTKPRGYGAIRILWLQSCFLICEGENRMDTKLENRKKNSDGSDREEERNEKGMKNHIHVMNSSHDSNHYFENQFGYRAIFFYRWNRLEKVLTIAIKPKYLKTKNHSCFAFFTKTSRQIPTIGKTI